MCLICQDIECVKPIMPMLNLPVVRIMDIEFVHIGKDITPEQLEHDLF